MAVLRKTAFSVACVAIFYQLWLREFLFDTLGVRRASESIESFPWKCRRLVDEKLEGCEDMWLDVDGRVLYAACSGSFSRGQWNPGQDLPPAVKCFQANECDRLSKYNVSGRRPGGSKLMSIMIDKPTANGFFEMHSIETKGYTGATGDLSLDLIGFDVDQSVPGELKFFLINHRPAVDAQKNFLDASTVGVNGTVEVFRYEKGSKQMSHLKTIAHPEVYSANNLALVDDGAFVLTNDHSGKVGFRKELDLLIGGGNVARCESNGECAPVTGSSLRFPNGLAVDKEGLVYVGMTAAPYVGVYRFTAENKLNQIDRIHVGMPVDNLSVDTNEEIWAVGITKMFDLIDSIGDPFNKGSPTTVFKIHKAPDGKYETMKVLEDREAKFVSSGTIAVFDAATEKLFVGGAATPFITVCESVKA
ncbi:serum paraoxonase/arylesteras-like protein [Periconia macrospinosa]|uniref:Serum paraoxonase/arylesteras-like protein n=1 Tax=Periconia macrospinosa TaxID=97972 RepID=A0A2V1DAH0_9PLEO|nr:serum paraoxonase/arylesteras-like protein [Periconia macrospinosa]